MFGVRLTSINALADVPWIEPSDVSEAVLWLASENAKFITGSRAAGRCRQRRQEGLLMQTIDHTSFFIDGEWRAAKSDRTFDVISPRSEERIGRVPAASRADIDDAVAAARKAFDEGPWPRMSPAERAEYLSRIAVGIEKRQQELAPLISEELGCSLPLSQWYMVVAPVLSFNYFAEVGRTMELEEVRVSDLTPFTGGAAGGPTVPMAGNSLVVREPIGVVASFPAYNFAFAAVGQKLGSSANRGVHCGAQSHGTQPPGHFVLR